MSFSHEKCWLLIIMLQFSPRWQGHLHNSVGPRWRSVKQRSPKSCRTGRMDFAPGLHLSDWRYFCLTICHHPKREFTVPLKQAFYFLHGDALGLGWKSGSFSRTREKNSSGWNKCREPTQVLHCCLLDIWSRDSQTCDYLLCAWADSVCWEVARVRVNDGCLASLYCSFESEFARPRFWQDKEGAV